MSEQFNTIKIFILIAFTLIILFISWYLLIAVAAILVIYYISKLLTTINNLTKEAEHE